MDHFETHEEEKSLQQVLENVSAKVPDVGEIVNCRSTSVELDLSRNEGLEFLFLAAQGIEESDHSKII